MDKQKAASDSLRIDRWLFFCRFFKTRTKASDAVTGGHVKVNDERVTPGTRVKVGDTIDVVRDRLHFRMKVAAIPGRRGPSAEARACYIEDEETARQRNEQVEALRQDRYLLPRTRGRPDKHTRRKLRERKGQ
ncbi:MAG: RNA-binding S4 domain-containing protein [Woeseiaceae bacterium]|nr:RNA-binding S4 domain-containing protein [Woeseiaceae bacterium]